MRLMDVASVMRNLQGILNIVIRDRDGAPLVECLLTPRKLWVPPPEPHKTRCGDT